MTKQFYRGFHLSSQLPVRAGERVRLNKGTLVQTVKGLRELKRAQVVTIDHILPGASVCVGRVLSGVGSHLNFSSRYDMEAVQETYGSTNLESLRGQMEEENSLLFLPLKPPSIRWAGSGGYWNEVDINQIL